MSRRSEPAVLARESAAPWGGPAWRHVAPGYDPGTPTVESLLARIRMGGEPDDGGEPRFLPALGRFLRSLDTEADLHAEGRRAAHAELAAALRRQRQTIQLLRDRPEIARIDIRTPLFLTGLPGSGAALLHNALAEHPGLDAPTLAELHDPADCRASPRRRREALERAGALARDAAGATAGRGSGLLLGAARAGGCHRLLGNAFHGMAATLPWHVPGYAAWLETTDMTEAYAFHRAQLQAVSWRIPVSRPVLRDSFHARYLPQLLRVYPDAKVIQVHRDPADTVTACAGIATALRSRTARRPPRVGQEWADRIERHLVAAERARSGLSQERVLDLRFEDLVADPARQVRAVLAFAGVTPTPLLDRVVAAFVARTARAARRSRPFQPAEFGLSRRELSGRFSLYRSRYKV